MSSQYVLCGHMSAQYALCGQFCWFPHALGHSLNFFIVSTLNFIDLFTVTGNERSYSCEVY